MPREALEKALGRTDIHFYLDKVMENDANPFGLYEKLGGLGIFLAFLVAALPLCLKAIKLWSNYRNDTFHLANRRTRRLNALAEAEAWKAAAPVTLQLAVSDALGVVIDDRSIRFVFERHRPISLLKDLKRVGGIVRLDAAGRKFEPVNGMKPGARTYRSKSIWTFTSGIFPYSAFVLLSPVLKNTFSRDGLLITFCLILGWLPFAFALSSMFEAAHRIVERLDERYPALKSEAAAAEAIVEGKPGLLGVFDKREKGLTEANIKVFLVGFLLAIVALIFLFLLADPELKEKYEFISYACPCAAGVLAGGALYLSAKKWIRTKEGSSAVDSDTKESDEKYFYICSVICLFAGLLSEVLASKCRPQSVIILCAGFVFTAVAVLIQRVIKQCRASGFKSVGYFGWSLTVIATGGTLLWALYLFKHLGVFFIHYANIFICTP